ncbi:TniB family NTP-binding protein [Jannaschia formosa]|uniref:TniB family NTP-binding protein n=1 Tax=Jannaschia formosa TaxID=2259592 RepID=UPI000E1BC019|nr:TniB family NTP-binding protein [Jannaschia formosa]TFL18458.1 hypothetical protein DR046_10225 [Jannaschia formosa]
MKMMTDLTPAKKRGGDLASADIAAKIAWLEARYLKTARDATFHDYLREIMEVGPDGAILPRPARDPLTDECRGIALVGNSDEGKSTLLRRNLAQLPGFRGMASGEDGGNYILQPVPQDATEKGLGIELARTTSYPGFAARTTSYDVWKVATTRMRNLEVGLLVIDEAHHILRSGAGRDRKGALQSLKSLLQGDASIAVILAGVPALEDALMEDRETDRRFIKLRLDRIAMNGDEMDRLRLFLDRCCTSLGLNFPEDRSFADRIAFGCGGNLGGSVKLAKTVLRRAIMAGAREIDLPSAAQALRMMRGTSGDGPFAFGDWAAIRKDLEAQGWAS